MSDVCLPSFLYHSHNWETYQTEPPSEFVGSALSNNNMNCTKDSEFKIFHYQQVAKWGFPSLSLHNSENTGPKFIIPSITNWQIPDAPITGAQKQRIRLQCERYIFHCLKTELPIGWNQEIYECSCLSNRILYGYNSYFRKTQNSFSEYESDVAGCEALVSLLSNWIGHMMQAADKIH